MIPMQLLSLRLGTAGCYFYTLIKAAENKTGKEFDAIREYYNFTKKKDENNNQWITDYCFCNRPDLILSDLIGRIYKVRKVYEPASYKYRDGDIIIGYFTCEDKTHFVLLDDKLNVIYDPYGESNTVKNGKLSELRVFELCH